MRARAQAALDGRADRDILVVMACHADPSTLALPSGQEVKIEVTNKDDVEHSFQSS